MSVARKIIIIGSAHPLRGGLAAFNERLAREYLNKGDQVIIYSFSLQYPSVFFPGKSQYTDEPAPAGLTIRTRINSVNPINWIRVGREISRQKPDLVLIKFWMPFMAPCFSTICRIIRRNRHTRIISIVDNIIPHEHRPGDRLLASCFVGSVDGFITMSESVLKELETFDQTKPKRYTPHPLYDHFGSPVPRDKALSELNLDPSCRFILFFGFIRDYKGLDLLLEALSVRDFRKLGVRLLIAGEFYCDPEPYHEIIRRHQLEDLVTFSNDFIPDSRVRYYFCAADLVVQPYKSATQSGVTQIAYHFDKPMIITDVGGLAEMVPHGKVGYVVPPDPEKIGEAMERFFLEEKAAIFSQQAAVEKKKYGWNKMLDAIDTLLFKP